MPCPRRANQDVGRRKRTLVPIPRPAYPEKQKNVQQHATVAVQNGITIMGVNGPSIPSTLPQFHIPQCVVYDSLHSQGLDVFRQLGSLWFDTSNSKSPWYIGRTTTNATIDERGLSIKSPSNVTRLFRPLRIGRDPNGFFFSFTYHLFSVAF